MTTGEQMPPPEDNGDYEIEILEDPTVNWELEEAEESEEILWYDPEADTFEGAASEALEASWTDAETESSGGQGPAEDRLLEAAQTAQDWEDGDGTPGPFAPFIRPASEIDSDASQKVPPLVRFLAWPGRLSLLAAREKDGGKTTIVSAAVAALSQGEPFGDLPTERARVLWVSEENLGDVKFRLTAQGADLSVVFVTSPASLMDAAAQLGHENHVEALVAAVGQLQPALWVIDTLDPFREGVVSKAASSDEWAPLWSALRRSVRSDGVAGLIIHHAVKSEGGGYRDSSSIGAAMDRIIEPVKFDAAKRPTEWRSRGKAGLFAEDFRVVSFDDDTQTPVLEALDGSQEERIRKQASEAGEKLQRDVYDFVGTNPRASTNHIHAGVEGSKDRVRQALASLKVAGLVVAAQGKRNSIHWSLAEPSQ